MTNMDNKKQMKLTKEAERQARTEQRLGPWIKCPNAECTGRVREKRTPVRCTQCSVIGCWKCIDSCCNKDLCESCYCKHKNKCKADDSGSNESSSD